MPPVFNQSSPKNGNEFLSRCDKRRQRWIGVGRVLMKEVDPQTRRHPSLAMEREKRIVHRVGVFVGEPGGRLVGVKRAAVAMRSDAELSRSTAAHRPPTLPRLGCQQFLAQSLQRSPGAWPAIAPSAATMTPRASSHALPCGCSSACRLVRPGCRPGAVDGIEFGQVRQTVSRRTASREIGPTVRDELACRNVVGARFQRRDRVGNREDVLERRVPAGPVADEDDVVVGVDDSGDHRLATRSTVCRLPPCAATLLPTAAKRPLRISACETTRLSRPSYGSGR